MGLGDRVGEGSNGSHLLKIFFRDFFIFFILPPEEPQEGVG